MFVFTNLQHHNQMAFRLLLYSISINKKGMEDLKTVFNIHNRGYFPPAAYHDANQLRYERLKKESKYEKDRPKKKLDLQCKKGTFLEAIEKRETALPAPNSYKPQQFSPSYKKRKYSKLPDRSTSLNDIIKENKKNPTPSPSQYKPLKEKSVSLVSFEKAQNTNYLDGVVYNGANSPGVGQYTIHANLKQELGKFSKSKRSESNKQNSWPSSTTYNPKLPLKLFCQIQKQKVDRPKFDRSLRFETQKPNNSTNKNMFYTGLAEWGMRTSYQKKDLLSTLSTHNIYPKSVYYR